MNVTDFNDLWKRKDTGAVPDMNQIMARASILKTKTRNKIIFGSIALLLTAGFITYIVWYYKPQMLTTKIGTLLVIAAIVMMIATSMRLIPVLNQNPHTSATQYLHHLSKIKKRQAFLQTTIMNWYFVLLPAGIFLYMIEYTLRLKLWMAVLVYLVTAIWIAFNWFFTRPRAVRKQQKALDEMIAALEKISAQFEDSSAD